MFSRRQILQSAGGGFGWAALQSLMGDEARAAAPVSRLSGTKAKNVIYLFMHGGVSHVDTFDPKPTLQRMTGQRISGEMAKGLKTSRIDFTKALVRGSPWEFKRCGKSGTEVSTLFPEVGACVDDLAVVRSCYGEAFDHAPAMYLRATGSQFPGKPSLGSWLIYGLGSENKNLPGFVVMADGAMKSGPQAYGAGFLPAAYQGTIFRNGRSPVLHLNEPDGITHEAQRATLDLIGQMDQRHLASRPGDSILDARIKAYELAYRMQSSAPEAVDIDKESAATRKLYGIGEGISDDFGRKCLLARRLVERGVRCVQLFSGTHLGDDWDQAHDDLVGAHGKMAAKTDRAIAGLLRDLKSRGMLDSTLVVWSGEFGRTPLAEGRNGRDHHPYGFSMWMAGGGIKGGKVIGATDELGLRAVESPLSIHDVNASILRLLGVDHTRLTFRFQSREQRLTDVHGEHEFTAQLLSG